jgi:hypothetical protein
VLNKLFLLCFFSVFSWIFSSEVCFLTTSQESAEDFVKLTRVLDEKKVAWKIFATGEAEKILRKEGVFYYKLGVWMPKKQINKLNYEEVISLAKLAAKACKKSKIVITEISDPFIARFHFELGLISSAQRWVYYQQKELISLENYTQSLDQILKTRPEGVIFSHKDLKDETLFGKGHKFVEYAQIPATDKQIPSSSSQEVYPNTLEKTHSGHILG